MSDEISFERVTAIEPETAKAVESGDMATPEMSRPDTETPDTVNTSDESVDAGKPDADVSRVSQGDIRSF